MFLVWNRKNEQRHWILYIWISLGTKFQLKLTILIFWTKFAHKKCFWSKREKVNSPIEFCIFELVLVRNFSLKWQFVLNLPKKGVSGPKEKNRTCACVHGCYTFRRRNGILMSFLLWLCKHEKGQKQPSSHSSTELSKTQFFPESIVNRPKSSASCCCWWLWDRSIKQTWNVRWLRIKCSIMALKIRDNCVWN